MAALRRRRPFLEPRPVWLVLCEGRVTERQYLRAWRSRSKAVLAVESCSGGALTMVRQGIRRKREARDSFDRVWCVTDADHLPAEQLREASLLASRGRVELLISNPCFELWALLHFEVCQAHLTVDEACRRLRTHLPGYDKKLPFDLLASGYSVAAERARKLDPSGEGLNPSTTVYRLTEALRESGPL
ncbi:MAG: RloB family protein [Thermoanaerobaculia bacterium]